MTSNETDNVAPVVPDVTESAAASLENNGPIERRERFISVQPLRKEEMQASYAQDLGREGARHGLYSSLLHACGVCFGLAGIFPCLPCRNPFREIQQGSVGLVSRFGQFYKAVDPGLVEINMFTETLTIVDIKTQILNFGRQSSLIDRTLTTLRHVVETKESQTLAENRESIAAEISETIGKVAEQWGVLVESYLIKNIIVPPAGRKEHIAGAKLIAGQAEFARLTNK